MNGQTAHLTGVAYAFPQTVRSVRDLGESGLLESDASVLESFGFAQVRVASAESPYELALQAAQRLLSERSVDPESVGLLIYGGTPGPLAFAPAACRRQDIGSLRTTDRFKYPGARLQYEMGLVRAAVLGLDQLACTTLFAAIRIARALCLSEGIERALCVSSEFFPGDAGREALFNCTSDAACAVLVERSGEGHRILGATHVSKGYYWDCDERRNEMVASYFPTARHVIEETLDRAGWTAGDVDWVLPHNVNQRSWEILLGLTPLPNARFWSGNIARDGHTLVGDNFINLRDALDSGAIAPGHKLLLFSYGYGAHWTGLALEA